VSGARTQPLRVDTTSDISSLAFQHVGQKIKEGFQHVGQKIKEGFHKVKDAFVHVGHKIKDGKNIEKLQNLYLDPLTSDTLFDLIGFVKAGHAIRHGA
jgi:hypothetical protein